MAYLQTWQTTPTEHFLQIIYLFFLFLAYRLETLHEFWNSFSFSRTDADIRKQVNTLVELKACYNQSQTEVEHRLYDERSPCFYSPNICTWVCTVHVAADLLFGAAPRGLNFQHRNFTVSVHLLNNLFVQQWDTNCHSLLTKRWKVKHFTARN